MYKELLLTVLVATGCNQNSSSEGVTVSSLSKESSLYKSGVRDGDRIISIDNVEMENIQHAMKILRDINNLEKSEVSLIYTPANDPGKRVSAHIKVETADLVE